MFDQDNTTDAGPMTQDDAPNATTDAVCDGQHTLKILTLNLHKGFSPLNRRFVLPELREAVRDSGADIVFLQEVLGQHDLHAHRVKGWPVQAQYEFMADTIWKDFAYGRNAVYSSGHHGNAILSRLPILWHTNLDVSVNTVERRGLLHCEVHWPDSDRTLHLICAHLGLREAQRQEQVRRLIRKILEEVPGNRPVVVAGDFNDWRGMSHHMLRAAGLKEVHQHVHGHLAKTFPARYPMLPLDRVYVRGVEPIKATVLSNKPWSHLSDHAPVMAEVRC